VLIASADDLPLGAAVCGANRQDATFTAAALASLVVKPPVQMQQIDPCIIAEDSGLRTSEGRLKKSHRKRLGHQLNQGQDVRALPYLRGDGNFAKIPARYDAKQQGLRLWAPDQKKGQSRRGLGMIRSSVERSHAFLNQFGRIFRRLDRRSDFYLGWVQLACCVIFMRRGFFP
jgi:hypothetical protein